MSWQSSSWTFASLLVQKPRHTFQQTNVDPSWTEGKRYFNIFLPLPASDREGLWNVSGSELPWTSTPFNVLSRMMTIDRRTVGTFLASWGYNQRLHGRSTVFIVAKQPYLRNFRYMTYMYVILPCLQLSQHGSCNLSLCRTRMHLWKRSKRVITRKEYEDWVTGFGYHLVSRCPKNQDYQGKVFLWPAWTGGMYDDLRIRLLVGPCRCLSLQGYMDANT